MEVIVLIMLFVSPIFNATLFTFGIASESGQLALIYLVLALLCYILFINSILKYKYGLKTYMAVIFILVFMLGFYTTSIYYNHVNSDYWSQFLSFGSMTVSSILMGIMLSRKREPELFGKWIPMLIILITLSSFLAVITSNSLKTGVYMNESSGFLYQNTSYYAAYAYGLNIYFRFFKDMLILPNWLTPKLSNIIFENLLILQIITCILAGGRGGFVLMLFFTFYAFIISVFLIKEPKQIYIYLSKLIVVGFILITLYYKLGLNVKYSGFERIMSIFSGSGDLGRKLLIKTAFQYISESPIIGNGIGSVFYEMGTYSHNIFIDILFECGMIGLIIFIIILLIFLKRLNTMIKINPSYHFIFVIFSCGIMLNLFSGYWLASHQMWFAISYVFSMNIMRLNQKRGNKNV